MGRQLTYPRYKLGEHARNVHRVNLEVGTTREELLDPAFFVNVSGSMRAGDIIEAVLDDYSRFFSLLIQKADRISVKVAVISDVTFEDAPAAEAPAEDFRIEHAGAQEQWRVIRLTDGVVIKTGLASEAAAKRELTHHCKTLGR